MSREDGPEDVFDLIEKLKDKDTARANELADSEPVVYEDYIQSERWKEKAYRAKKRAGFRCQLCNQGGELHAHHRTYVRLGYELPMDLTVLCSTCHEVFHDERKHRLDGEQIAEDKRRLAESVGLEPDDPIITDIIARRL